MVKLKEFFNIFKSKKIVNFYGVPDSLLKDFIEYLNNKKDLSNIISVNEGAAVSSAIGHYLASKKWLVFICKTQALKFYKSTDIDSTPKSILYPNGFNYRVEGSS